MASAEIKAMSAIDRVLDRQLDSLSGPERDRVMKWLTARVLGQTPTQPPLPEPTEPAGLVVIGGQSDAT